MIIKIVLWFFLVLSLASIVKLLVDYIKKDLDQKEKIKAGIEIVIQFLITIVICLAIFAY